MQFPKGERFASTRPFGAADDQYFKVLKDPLVIGEHFMLPQDWLPQPKTVISFFLPFTEAVKKGNRRDMSWPSEEWLHGRIEGQALVIKLCQYLSSELINAGYKSLAPSLDERFWARTGHNKATHNSDNNGGNDGLFTSNWSERHVAFICGLGTFGLSKGLITEKGLQADSAALLQSWSCRPIKGSMKAFMVTVLCVAHVGRIVQSMRYPLIRGKTTNFVINL